MKNVMLPFCIATLLATSAWSQSFKPDRSYAMKNLLIHHHEVHSSACTRGFYLLEVYYLLTEHQIRAYFPVAGLFWDDHTDEYTLWSNYLDPRGFFKIDSIDFQGLGTDGIGIWLRLDIQSGRLDPPTEWDLPREPNCTSVGIYIANTDLHNPLKKLKTASFLTCPCGEDPFDQLPKARVDKIRSWPNADAALGFLKQKFPDETRAFKITNFGLLSKGISNEYLSRYPWMVQLMFCPSPNALHYFGGEYGNHDAYILRYFFDTHTWMATHTLRPADGWGSPEDYLNDKATPLEK